MYIFSLATDVLTGGLTYLVFWGELERGSKHRTFIQVNKEQNILLMGWTREMPSDPVRIPNSLLPIRSKTPCDSWAMLVSPPIMAKSRQKETRLQKSQRKRLICSASVMDSNIHPASRGVAAHTAGLFRSVRRAKGGFPPWRLFKLRSFNKKSFQNIVFDSVFPMFPVKQTVIYTFFAIKAVNPSKTLLLTVFL